MCRTAKLFLATLIAGVVSAGVASPPGVLADELDDLLTGGRSSGTVADEDQVRKLLATLREAERQQAEKRQLEQTRASLGSGGDGAVAPAGSGPASNSEAKRGGNAGAVAENSATGEAETEGAETEEAEKLEKKEEPEKVVRAGCMYSGTKLIWEKVPGACRR